MFKRLPHKRPVVRFYFDGVELLGMEGDSIAAALLAANHSAFGSHPVSGAERGPYCLMGSCYECIVQLEHTAVQACQVPISEGLKVVSCR